MLIHAGIKVNMIYLELTHFSLQDIKNISVFLIVTQSELWTITHYRVLCTTTQWFRLYVYNMTSSNGNLFRVTGHLWGESTGDRWIPLKKASDAIFYASFDLRLNKLAIEMQVIWGAIALIITSP